MTRRCSGTISFQEKSRDPRFSAPALAWTCCGPAAPRPLVNRRYQLWLENRFRTPTSSLKRCASWAAMDDGLLLVATKPGGESDVTMICWGTTGPVWGRPVFTVLARPSRCTYQFIEEANDLTVNVPTPAMSEFALFCGTKSGRAHDKLARFQMSVSPRANGQIRDH